MHTIIARRLAGPVLTAVIAIGGALAAPAAQAAPAALAAADHVARPAAAPAGFTDPCPPSGPDDASCGVLVPARPAGTAKAGTDAAPLAASTTTPPAGWAPADLQKAYDLQGATSGSGQTVAVVTAYNDPSAASDLAVYRSQYGLQPCTVADGCLNVVNQTGGSTLPGTSAGFDVSVSQSVDAISAICPNCHITVVEANSTNVSDLGAAENEAATRAKFITNAWTIPEASGETSDDTDFDHPGVAITAPAGNSGYGAITYPAASQYVTAVGGTVLTADSSASRGFDESVWPNSGSGCSAYEAKPAWQTGSSACNGKTLNDLSAVATNVAYYDTPTVGGWGTSADTVESSAIIAAAYAVAGTPGSSDYPAEYPYEHPGGAYTTPGNAYPYADGLNNITSGSTGSVCVVSYLCTAGAGYSGPAGLGSPASALSLSAAGGQTGDIFSGITDICLDDRAGGTATGTSVQIYNCNGLTTQDWAVEPDGTVRFDSSYCMADSGKVTTGGFHLIDIQPCDNTNPAMQWQPRSNGSLYNPATGWCLADPGASTTYGTQVIDGTCNGSASQQWTIPYTRPAFPGAVQYKITTASICLHDSSGLLTNGNPVDIYRCDNGTSEDDWTVASDGTLQFQGHCAVPLDAGTADSTPIVLWTCEGEATQYWTERSDGTFINNVAGRCLTDTNGNTTNSTQLVLLHCSASAGWTPHDES